VQEHLGVGPGDDLEIDFLPERRVSVKGPSRGRIEDFFGSLKNENDLYFTIEEKGEEIAKARAGEK
jgi:hypothetical protein